MQESQLVINAGSTTVKYTLFLEEKKLLEVIYENHGKGKYFKSIFLQRKKTKSKISSRQFNMSLWDFKSSSKTIHFGKKHPIQKIGFRYVHGGIFFREATKVSTSVLKKLKIIDDLAPLHNPKARILVEQASKEFPRTPKILFFDTAFHNSISEVNWRYGLSKIISDKHHIRVYGFHGIVCSSIFSKLREEKQLQKRLIICHLGGGASVTSIKNGKSTQTSMGFTPLDGLMMTTRCGSLDPGALLYLLEKNIKLEELKEILNKESGLKGMTGTRDMREILKSVKKKNKDAVLALEMFCQRAAEEIAKQSITLGGIDQIVFSGGIGENAWIVREKICHHLVPFGIKIDDKKNRKAKEGENISKRFSRKTIQWIHADEAAEINRQMLEG